MHYVMSVGYDRDAEAFYTVTVPNRRHSRLVISRFARSDMTLSEELRPGLAPGVDLAGEERSLDEYYIIGVAVDEGHLYAVSAAFSTLLVFDLGRGELVSAHGLDGPERPTGLALRGSDLYVVDAGGEVVVVERSVIGGAPAP